jgi:hypothetical protein
MSSGYIIERNGVSYIAYSEYEAEVNHLAKRIKEFEEVIAEQDEARVDLLAELILISQSYHNNPELMRDDLQYLIKLHHASEIRRARKQLRMEE